MINFDCTFTESISALSVSEKIEKQSPVTKWIHKSGNKNFTDTKAWGKTIEYNKELEKLINSVVTECTDYEACFDSVIGYIMHIESVTSELFDAIDRIKTEECKKRL